MTGLPCPQCGSVESITMTSRPHANGRTRRRRCSAGHRFTTIEVVTTGKPRRLLGLELSDIRLAKAKTIASITALLERAL